MLLKIPTVMSKNSARVTVKRDPETRDNWVSFYKSGKRMCRVAFKDGCCHCVLTAMPEVNKGSITFSLGLFLINEVWGGLDNQLSTIFVNFNGVNYMGTAISGWKFKRYDGVLVYDMVEPSWQAEARALEFLAANCDELQKENIDEHSTDTTNAANS